jgi:trigger factor
LEYTVIKKETSADLHLTYLPEDIEIAFTKAYEKAAKKVKIDGFRPGKAPLGIVKKVLGESVTQDALNILLSESIGNLQPNLEFKTFGDPKIEIEKFERKETLIAKASFELAPEVTLGEYSKISVNTHEIEVSDSDIEEHLKEIQFQLAKTSSKESEESIEGNDMVDMDFKAVSPDGITVQEKNNYLHYLGKNPVNIELEKHLIGLKVGTEKDFEFIYPESTPDPTLVGKSLNYHVKINEIFRVLLPDLDDAFANEWREEFQTLEDLKNNLKTSLKNNITNRFQQKYFDSLLKIISERSNYLIPSSMIETEIDHIYHEYLHELKIGHVPMEKFAEIVGQEVSEIRKGYEAKALMNIKNILGIYKIAGQEKITVSQEELTEAIEIYRNNQSAENLKNVDLNKVVRNLHENILIDKVFKFLLESADKTSESISVQKAEEILSGK